MEKESTYTNYRILLEKYLKGNLSKEEEIRLYRWYLDAANQEVLTDFYRQKWNGAPASMDRELQRQIFDSMNAKRVFRLSSDRKIRILSAWRKYAAMLLLPLAGALFTYWLTRDAIPESNSDSAFSVVVERGQKSTFYLPDGTVVWLNSDSKLSVAPAYNGKDRVVHLEGEACFEVAKDALRPFIVKARELEIEALGTQFDVKAYGNDRLITTTLLEGSVAVRDSCSSILLNPNEKAVYDTGRHSLEKSSVSCAAAFVSWKNNELFFEKESLEHIAETLERLYNVTIVFESERLKYISLTGKIKNNNLENVFQLINMTSPVRYMVRNDTIILKEK